MSQESTQEILGGLRGARLLEFPPLTITKEIYFSTLRLYFRLLTINQDKDVFVNKLKNPINCHFLFFLSMNFYIFVRFEFIEIAIGYGAFNSFTRCLRLKNGMKLIFLNLLSYWRRDQITMNFYLVRQSCYFFVRNDISWTSLFYSHIPVMWKQKILGVH